jgi:hypothetical protein
MERIVVRRERAHAHVVLFECRVKLGLCVVVVQVLRSRQVVFAGVPTAPQFDGVDADAVEIRERVFE